MRKSHRAVSTMVLSGALVIGSGPAWSQSNMGSGSSGATSGSQDQQRSRANQVGNEQMSGQGQWSREDIRGVQEALRDKGHNPGAIDGIMGPRTQQALRQFQQAQNLQATGQLDANTASALGVASATGATGSGASSSTAGRSGSGTGGSAGSMGTGTSGSGSSSGMAGGSSGGSTGSSGGSSRGTTGSGSGATGSGSGSGATR